jgi:uncharacterized protein (DUF1684 family)
VPGVVHFRLGGQDYAVNPLLDEGWLLLVFADATTGTGTRPPSRLLRIALPLEGLDYPGTVGLDFNRAFLPPCAFSDEFNCPLPPSKPPPLRCGRDGRRNLAPVPFGGRLGTRNPTNRDVRH